jgi:hypothetical protein
MAHLVFKFAKKTTLRLLPFIPTMCIGSKGNNNSPKLLLILRTKKYLIDKMHILTIKYIKLNIL